MEPRGVFRFSLNLFVLAAILASGCSARLARYSYEPKPIEKHKTLDLAPLEHVAVDFLQQQPPTNVNVNAKPAQPTISNMNPVAGLVGSSVTITGSGFAATQGSGTVTFNGVTATVTSWSSLSLTVTVPTLATTGPVVVNQNGLTSSSVTYTVQSSQNCTPDNSLTTAAAIQTALTNAAAGTYNSPTLICLPAMSLSVTTPITATVRANVTLMGQTTTSGTMGSMSATDATILTNNTGGKLFSLTLNTTGVYRQSGLTYQSGTCSDHPLNIEGSSNTYPNVRFDHSHWLNYCNFNFEFANARGVVDHNYFENPSGPAGANQNRAMGFDDDVEWTHETRLGSSDFNWFYNEDNRFERGIFNDCFTSGRQAFRYNYMNNGGTQEHGTGHSGQNRGCRAMIVDHNTIIGGAANTTAASSFYTGTGLFFNNTVTGTNGTYSVLHLVENRQSNYTYDPGTSPNKWGPCGSNFNTNVPTYTGGSSTDGGSVWDGNTDATGYPCLDQVGRGPGDLLSGNFTTKANSTRGCIVNFTWANRGLVGSCGGGDSTAWPRQSLEPLYEWSTTASAFAAFASAYRCSGGVALPGGSNGGCSLPGGSPNIVQDRDFYLEHSNTSCNAGAGSCTAGVGTGTLAQMPNNCTTNVAFFATDTNALYKCQSTNSWRWYFSPLTYPHPNQKALPTNNYSTNFPTVENPIAEQNSVWTNGSAAGGSLWGDLKVIAGNQVQGVSQPTNFGDPTAILKGTWSANQGAQAVVKVTGTPAADSEVEIRLRTTISTNTITGYEAYCSVAPSDKYCHIASWGGPNGTFSNFESTCFTETHAASSCPARNNDTSLAYLVDGDTLSATVTGNCTPNCTTDPVIIKLYINGVERERASDNGTLTFQCTSAPCGSHGPWLTGAPGLGFFSSGGLNFTTHGFTKFSAFGQ